MNTQLIQDIILSVLEENDGCTLALPWARKEVAQKVAQALTLASLEQLAALMGTNLSYDCNGQALIFTGVYDQNKADEIAQSDFDAELAYKDEIELYNRFAHFASDDVNPTEVP
jgi:hypothetical protein